MTNYEINQVLVDWLKAMPQAPPIQEENKPESAAVATAKTYLVEYFMPTNNEQSDFCGNEEKTGLYQVTVVSEREIGRKKAQQMADSIVDRFKYSDLSGLVITRAVAAASLTTDLHYQIPISIYYTYMG